MLELLQLLGRKIKNFDQVVPVVFFLRFSNNDNTQVQDIHTFNELTEILAGIYNTRNGRSYTAVAQLKQFVNARHGVLIDEPLGKNDREVPMNWMLSDQSMQNILGDVDKKMKDTTSNGVKVRLFEDGLHYLPSR